MGLPRSSPPSHPSPFHRGKGKIIEFLRGSSAAVILLVWLSLTLHLYDASASALKAPGSHSGAQLQRSKRAMWSAPSPARAAKKQKIAGQGKDEKIDNFREWLAKNDASMESIEIAGDGGDRGAFASADIPPGGLLIRVPGRLIMTDERAAATAVGRLVTSKGGTRMNALQVWLVAQKFANGAGCSVSDDDDGGCTESGGDGEPVGGWQPYIDVLPEAYENPLWWSEEERAHLFAGTSMLNFVQGREQSLREDHARLFAPLCKDEPSLFQDEGIFSYDHLLWAASTIWSRGFPSRLAPRGGKEGGAPQTQDKRDTDVVPFNATHSVGDQPFAPQGKVVASDIFSGASCTVTSSPHNVSEDADAAAESSSCLMPLADMLNHRPNTCITWLCTPQGVDFVSPDGVPRGAEVHNNYGPRPNRGLLLNYGFAIEKNPSDTYEVVCRLPPGMPDWEQRIELALRQGARIDSSHGRLITGLAPCLPLCGAGPLLTLFRLTSATKEELEDYASSSPQGPSVANDMAAHNALVDELRRVRARLEGAGGGVVEGGGAGSVGRLAAAGAYRRGAQTIVSAALESALDSRAAVAALCLASGGCTARWLDQAGSDGRGRVGREAYDAYREWLRGAGGGDYTRVSDSGAEVDEGGISKGGAALSFPGSVLITADAAMESDAEFADALEEHVEDLEEESVVALFIMRQRKLGEASAWHPWLQALPEPLPTNGVCGPGGHQLPVAQEMLEEFEGIFPEQGGLPKEFFSSPGEDAESLKLSWLWANVLIETRSVDTRALGGAAGCCVVPLAAAPLHAEASPFCWRVGEGGVEEGGLVLEAACDIPRGTPITMCYGRGMDSTVLEQLHGQALKAESPAPGGIEAAPGAGGG